MLLWKSWFDLRLRFFCSLAVLLFLLAVNVGIYPYLNNLKPADEYSRETLRRLVVDYKYYINTQWFRTNASVSLYMITVLLALGGIVAEKKKGTLPVTLSMPLDRWNWIVAHAGMTGLLLLGLTASSGLGTILGSLLIGKSYHLADAIVHALGIWLACFPLIGLSLLVNSFLHSGIKSALVMIPIYLMGPQLIRFMAPGFYRWSPWQLADPELWKNSTNWQALPVALLIGLGATAIAAYKFVREET